ncbi:MAG TPA: hypothetical protein VLA30_00645 [Burkholderiales bacterium]|nr:hypothetical protein [Burkholderiales bacterium]
MEQFLSSLQPTLGQHIPGILGAIAVALSFGLGGREAADKQMEYWLAKWRK